MKQINTENQLNCMSIISNEETVAIRGDNIDRENTSKSIFQFVW
ncbi:MAG: hypothetical protein ABF649_19810 [Bacillus sp. (in: firmicutes)]